MGRLVKTHSSYIEGLIDWLDSLSKEKGIQTVTPGVIGRTKGRSSELRLKISTRITGGYKLIARKGNTFQEVFILTNLDEVNLQQALIRNRKKGSKR